MEPETRMSTGHVRQPRGRDARRGPRAAGTGTVLVLGALLVSMGLMHASGRVLAGPSKSEAGAKKQTGKKKASSSKGSGKKGGKGSSSDKVIVWLRVGEVVKGGVEVVVQPFQRLQDIAGAYDVSTSAILKANKGVSANMIKAGQTLFIPGATSVKAIKTLVPGDKMDALGGIGVQVGGAASSSSSKGKKGGGKDLIKSGKVTSKGVVHTVQQGQTLHIIASAYDVGVSEILKANNFKNENIIHPGQKILVPGAKKVVGVPGIESDATENGSGDSDADGVRSGKIVKAGVLHTVMPGQTLWDISKAYNMKVDSILKANGLKNENMIKVGSKLLLPGAKKVEAVACSSKSSLMYVHPVTFHRIHTGETKSLNLFTATGKLQKGQVKLLQELMFDHRTKKQHKIHPRLISLIAKVAQHFEFRTIIIYSGFRVYSKDQPTKESKHNVGRAIDFAVEGVSNWKVMKYCRTFSNVGVGYYPKSYFVHLDVREKDAFWIDYSGPGQKPKYGKKKPGLEKKAKIGSKTPKKDEVNSEAESDAEDVGGCGARGYKKSQE
jgi:LysM repeat protein